MLRHEIVQNFIHFQDKTEFDFHPGPNCLIGHNCAGKSSVFEATRRCLSVSQSTSFSNPHFKDRISSTTCIFYIEDGQRGKGKLLSTAIRIPPVGVPVDNNVCVKACFETIDKSLGIDLVKETESGHLINGTVDLEDTETITRLFEKVLENTTEKDIDYLIDELVRCAQAKIGDFIFDRKARVNDTVCEKILRRYLDDTTVLTFSVRGIGPCQWSRSPKVHNDYKQDNYESAQERSEILQWYMKEKLDKKILVDDQNLVEKYFGIITNNSGIHFELELDDKSKKYALVALESKAGKRSVNEDQPKSKSFPVLKVPEGLLEAMTTSILLGVSHFKTICLEEPGKGMNPQMIERLRDLVLRRIKDKTVLITSHHPSFLGPWTVPKLYIFKRSENEHGLRFSVYSGSDIEPDGSDKKSPRIITSDNFAAIFFAKRVMFVEGEGDYLFMSSLKQLLLTDDELAGDLIDKDPEIMERFLEFICSLHIISIGGETQKLRLNRLALKIGLERYFLLDYDAIVEDKRQTADTFLNDFNLDKKEFAGVLHDVSMLEKEGLFVWNRKDKSDKKQGKIEDAFIELTKLHEGLKKFLDNNNVLLKYNPSTKVQNRNKLFRNKELTDDNITKVVHKVAKCCVEDKQRDRSTEMRRLLAFVSNISKPKAQQHSS